MKHQLGSPHSSVELRQAGGCNYEIIGRQPRRMNSSTDLVLRKGEPHDQWGVVETLIVGLGAASTENQRCRSWHRRGLSPQLPVYSLQEDKEWIGCGNSWPEEGNTYNLLGLTEAWWKDRQALF